MSEFTFINRLKNLIQKPADLFPNALNFEDDVCVLAEIDGQKLIASQDSICENIHFFANDPLEMIVKKAIRVNISDIACKGAKPYGMLLSLCLPSRYHNQQAQDVIYQALKEDMTYYTLPLLGGDITSGNSLTISITILGLCTYPIPLRKNIQMGDYIYVTGQLGLSKIGLDLRLGQSKLPLNHPNLEVFHQAYLLPDPPLKAGIELAPYMNAAMDISDGLLGDLQKMINASNPEFGFILDYDQIPCADIEMREYALECALHGGDDYQILFTSHHDISILQNIAQKNNIIISQIGKINKTKNNKYFNSFSHF